MAVEALDQQDSLAFDVGVHACAHRQAAVIGKPGTKSFVTRFMAVIGIGNLENMRRGRAAAPTRKAEYAIRECCQADLSPDASERRGIAPFDRHRLSGSEARDDVTKLLVGQYIIIGGEVARPFYRRMILGKYADRTGAVGAYMRENGTTSLSKRRLAPAIISTFLPGMTAMCEATREWR
jgi:hypothetical protein